MRGRGGGKEVIFRGQRLGRGELQKIAVVIRRHRHWTCEEIARSVCRRFGWKQGNGQLAVRACRNFLKRQERDGRWQLPVPRRVGNGRGARRLPAWCASERPPITERVGELRLRLIDKPERAAWQQRLAAFHYLGAAAVVGESLWYEATLGDEPVAVVVWGAATLRNAPRDRYVGWDSATRISRLSLVANNTRFLILPWVHVPNLASQILARTVRRLCADWAHAYGHAVRLAETFVDAERFRGTCYRAANWREVGQTRGFSRCGASYTTNGQPKRVFVYALDRHARVALNTACEPLPAATKKKAVVNVELLPILGAQGLFERLGQVVDPRKRRGVRHPLQSVLAIAACAVLSGAQSLGAIAEWALPLTAEQLRRFGSRRPKAPSERTLRRLLGALDAAAFDRIVGQWAEEHCESVGRALAIDGKTLRGSADADGKAVHLLAALMHHEAVVTAQMAVPDKTNEIPCAKELLAPLDLSGTVVTADALHTQRETARYLVEDKGADYLFTVKENQSTLYWDLARLPQCAFSPVVKTTDKGHGRLETRAIWVSHPRPDSFDFPYVAQVARIERVRLRLKDNSEQRETVFCITSLTPEKADAPRLLKLNRDHWSIENRLHYVRDRTFDEDRSQVRKRAAPHMMASLRNLAIGLLRLAGATTNIAAAARFFMRNAERAMELLGVPALLAT